MFIFDTWSLILDIWHWYLTSDTWHLIPDTWYLKLVVDMLSLNTWYLTPNIWQLMIDKLSLDTWHMLSLGTDTIDMMLWYLTRQYYTWHLYNIFYSWLSLLRGLDVIIILLSPGTPVLLNPCTPKLMYLLYSSTLQFLIARSYRRPAEHATDVGITRMYPTVMLAPGDT